eukprot:3333450-Amphidinium_carterae.1
MRHDNELTALTLEDIQERLGEAAAEASEQRTIDDGRDEVARGDPSSTQMDTSTAPAITPTPVRCRLPPRKGGSALSTALTPSLAAESQAA